MLQLGSILYSKGFSITIAHTNFNSPNPQNHPHFSFLPLRDGLTSHEIEHRHPLANLAAINNNCKEILQRSLEQLREEKQEEITCIISDEYMYFCEEVANNLKLPSITLSTTSAATTIARPGLAQLKKEGQIPCQDSRLHELVPNLHPLRFKDLSFPIPHLDKFVFLVEKTFNNRTSSAIISNTVDCLEHSTLEQIRKQRQVPIFDIGPIHKIAPSISSSLIEEDRNCIAWLDKQPHNSVIYVSSSGSIASLKEKEAAEMAWGLASSNQPFLWVIRPGSIQGSNWIELLPEGFQDAVAQRGCVVKWVPQKEVLAHKAVGGFWSHCGWNSTLEGIAEGVPMICKPFNGDQWVNARYLNHVWRVGLELEELERGEIERAVRKLLLDNEGKEIRARAQEMKTKFEHSIREGGSSYNSLNGLVDLIISL
ncbi:hypothetical protein UlMin_013331 [Ulmus minor]